MKNPTALLSKEQVFNDPAMYSSNGPSSKANDQYFPDPDPELVNSPIRSNFKTTPREQTTPRDPIGSNETHSVQKSLEFDKENKLPPSNQPGRPGSPIKIGSPIKLVKGSNGTIVYSPTKSRENSNGSGAILGQDDIASEKAIESNVAEKPEVEVQNSLNPTLALTPTQVLTPEEQNAPSYFGKEITNNKLRTTKEKQEPSHEKKLSMVSVPSMYTNSTVDPSRASSNTLLNNNNTQGESYLETKLCSRQCGERK